MNRVYIFISSTLEQGTYFCGLSGTGLQNYLYFVWNRVRVSDTQRHTLPIFWVNIHLIAITLSQKNEKMKKPNRN